MESAKLIADLTVYFVQVVKRIMEATAMLGVEYDAASLEEQVAMEMRALGAVIFEYCYALRCKENGRPKSVECECGRRRVCKGRVERSIRTTLGEMNLTERYRYRCPACGSETIVGDGLRGDGNFSELAERLMAYAGQKTGGMYQEAVKSLKRFMGFDVTGKTIQAVCVRRAERVIASERRALIAPHEVKVEDSPERLGIVRA